MKTTSVAAPALFASLVLALLTQDARGQEAAKPMPPWLVSEMTLLTTGEGRWKADNAAYKSADEPMDAFGLKWAWGPGRTSVSGALFGHRGTRETPPFWEFRLFWNPLRSEARLLQWGGGGAYSEGTMTRLDNGDIQVDQVLWNGSQEVQIRHVERMLDGDRKTFDYRQEAGKWVEGRSYVWRSVPAEQSSGATLVRLVTGLDVPESARFDAARDAWLVSNVTGPPTRLDNTGFISVLDADGRITERHWISGGKHGVTLNAPKGMILTDRELWVADIDTVRRFDRTTGRPTGETVLKGLGAKFLNDLALGPDGSVYVSDTGFSFDAAGQGSLPGPHVVFRIDPALNPTVLVSDPRLEGPNGLLFERTSDRLLIASFNGKNLFEWTPSGGLKVVATGPGGYDGIEQLGDGRIVVSSQDGRAVLVLDGDRLTPLLTSIEDAGDLGVDTKRNRIAVPRLDTNLLEIWQLR